MWAGRAKNGGSLSQLKGECKERNNVGVTKEFLVTALNSFFQSTETSACLFYSLHPLGKMESNQVVNRFMEKT